MFTQSEADGGVMGIGGEEEEYRGMGTQANMGEKIKMKEVSHEIIKTIATTQWEQGVTVVLGGEVNEIWERKAKNWTKK